MRCSAPGRGVSIRRVILELECERFEHGADSSPCGMARCTTGLSGFVERRTQVSATCAKSLNARLQRGVLPIVRKA